MITADEVSLAGGYYGKKNEKYYLTTGEYYWTITPSDYKSNYAFSYVFQVFPEGDLRAWAVVSSWQGIRPVINIRSDVLISSGDGTVDSPYTLKLSWKIHILMFILKKLVILTLKCLNLFAII